MSKVLFGTIELPTLIAITELEKSKGLMGASWPPPIMSFPSDNPQICKFWMKNTPSPLDIIFCYAGKIVSIEKGIPNSERYVGPNCVTDLVVELPFGMAASLNLQPGTSVSLRYSLAELARRVELNLAKYD